MRNGRYVGIDADKLNRFILKNFHSREAFANTIGRSDTWLVNTLKRGACAMSDVIAIKTVHKLDIGSDIAKPLGYNAPKVTDTKVVEVPAQTVDIQPIVRQLEDLVAIVTCLSETMCEILKRLPEPIKVEPRIDVGKPKAVLSK